LASVDGHPERVRARLESSVDLGERFATVHRGLARAEKL
jgi:hypothetical protein